MMRLSWLSRRGTALFSAVAMSFGAAATVTVAAAPAAHAADSAYVMAYFKESPNGSGNSNAVHMAVSTTGLEWQPLNNNNPILTPTLGTRGIRDPFIFRLNNGSWVLMATDICNGCNFGVVNQNLHIWTSADGVNWSGDRLLRVNTHNSFTWAPAIFWDPARSQYGITFSTIPNGRTRPVIMVVYTTNFTTVSAPQVFFDGGNTGVIDAVFATNVGGTNYMYYRDDATTSIRGARSSSLNPGSFTTYTGEIQVSDCIEAPTLVRQLSNTSNWYLWGDNYCPNGRLYAWQGNLTGGGWSRLNDNAYTAPQLSKHNSIHTIESSTYNALLSRYTGQNWNRIKSLNFPDRYVRHSNNAGRIDAIPFDPYQDAQWRIRPGLANSAAVSIESVNFPGRFLRHVNNVVVLAANDNTATFRADATFYRVAGLGNSGWSSFRSYNFPDRYIRHSGFALRLDANTGGTFNADATFRVVY